MKKTFVKLGLLALALAFVLVSCAQPTEEAGGGPNAPTIIRLYLDRDDATLRAGADTIQIRVGEELYGYGSGILPGPTNTYPYPLSEYPAGTFENQGRTDGDLITDADRKKVTTIPPRRVYSAEQILQVNDPKKKYLASGEVSIVPSIADATDDLNGVSIQVDAKGIYYVDIPLVNLTVASKDRGSIYAGSISGWVELRVDTGGGADAIHDKALFYTKDKHGFNDLWKMRSDGTAIWKTTNSNIKKVSLKPGINELYLSYFSYDQFAN